MTSTLAEAYIETPLGILHLEGDKNGLQKVGIMEHKERVTEDIPGVLLEAVSQLKAYFNGNRTTFHLKLNPQGTAFQQRVWKELLNIPFGKTTTYLDMAKRLGDPKTIRAAASANGKNPLMIIIPCHRVIGSDGSLTGYAGGIWRKQWLLEHESPVAQQKLF